MFFRKKERISTEIFTTEINSTSEVDDIINNSDNKFQIFFKHSTTCSISAMAYNRINNNWKFDSKLVEIHYLDLLNHRDISNYIAEISNVKHESPQIIIYKNNEVIYHNSHNGITIDDIEKVLKDN